MNYLELINLFWAKDVEYHFSDRETALYFYLLNACNAVRWRNPFGLSNNMTMARFGWGRTSLEGARSRLKVSGLIDFRAGVGRGNTYMYVIRGINDDSHYTDEKDTQTTILFEQFSAKGHEKAAQADTFYGQFSEKDNEKGAQANTFSEQFSQKGHVKDTQPDTFSNHFYVPETAKTEAFQKSLNNKHKYKLITKGRISISVHGKGKSGEPYPVKQVNDEKEKSSVQKEKEVIELYRAACGSFPQIMQLTGKRREKILRRLTEMGGLPTLEQVFKKMEASDFLKGNNKAGWKASFDWVFENPDNWVKVLEGNYDNHAAKPANDTRFMGKLQTDLSRF